MNTKRAPKVRFKGFTDAWELRKLRDVTTEIVAGGDIDKDLILDEGRYPVIANALTNDGIVGYYNTDYRIEAPAVTVTGRGDVGHAKARIVDFTPVVRLLSIKSYHDVFFLENAINTLKIVIESTGVPQLTVPQLAKYEISFPKSLDEEEKIGNFFCTIDNLITLHQRKLDKIKDMRKAFLNLIFSQKLRFCGSNQSWRKLKIEDCFSERVERSEKGELISVTVNFGIVKAHSLARKDNSSKNKSHYKIVRKDDIAYNSMRMWQGASGISLYEGILSPAYTVIVPKQGISSLFFSYEFKLKKMLQTFQVNSQGLTSDTWNLKFPLLKNIVVEVPEYEEQEKVGIFFKKLDNLITLHQEKINQLTKLKTTLLKNMFI